MLLIFQTQLHSWWLDANAYTETTRPLFAKASGFPLSLYVTKKMQSSASDAVYTPLQKQDITEQEIDKLVRLGYLEKKKFSGGIYLFVFSCKIAIKDFKTFTWRFLPFNYHMLKKIRQIRNLLNIEI